jgi:hypothetical protein
MTWDHFQTGFCEVGFFCLGGEPNSLGWGVLVFGGISVVAIVLAIIRKLSD